MDARVSSDVSANTTFAPSANEILNLYLRLNDVTDYFIISVLPPPRASHTQLIHVPSSRIPQTKQRQHQSPNLDSLT